MIYNQDEAKELLADVIAIRDAQQKEIAQLQHRATGRVPIYALSIGDFPPPMRNDPIACLRFFFCTMFHYATPGEFDALTPGELKARVESNAAFEKMKEYWNGKIDELKDGIAAVGAEAKRGADAAESADSKIKAPRADKGGKHKKRTNISGAWRTAKEVAEEFTQAFNHGRGFTPKGGKRKLGILTEKTVNDWDAACPDFQHKNKWGYYAQLRIDSDLKAEYYEVLGYWLCDLTQHQLWDKQHPGVKYRRMKRADVDPATQIGMDENGKIYTKPKSADEIRRIKKVAGRAHVRLHKGWE